MNFDHRTYRNRRHSNEQLSEKELAFYCEVLKNSAGIIPGITVTNSGVDNRPGFMGVRQALAHLDRIEETVGLTQDQKILFAACELGMQHRNWHYSNEKIYG